MKKCECGCGQITKIITKTSHSDGRIKGERSRFIHGHHAKGKMNGRWIGGRKLSWGYVLIYSPHHPKQIKNYVYEHVLVMEKFLNRFLKRGEVVHHIDGSRDNNNINNLALCKNASEHMKKYHQNVGVETRFKKGWNKCQKIKQ